MSGTHSTHPAGEIASDALDQLFRQARTHSAWLPRRVPVETLREVYALARFGPTSANSSPARFLFLESEAAKARLLPALAPQNVEKTKAAPVTAIIAWDVDFFDQLLKLFPHFDMRPLFAGNAALAEETAFRNSSLQGGYFILAARAVGLDCGPMSGFDNAKVDTEFFPAPPSARPGQDAEVMPSGRVKSDFLCNLGYGDPAALHPRSPRLEFDEAC